jgi:hypothetical protein
VSLHGALANPEFTSDLRIGQPSGDEEKDLALAWGELLETVRRSGVGGARRANSVISRRVIAGERIASPRAAALIPLNISSAGTCLSGKPQAPATHQRRARGPRPSATTRTVRLRGYS